MESSKKSVILSLIYKFLERCGCQGVSFIVQIVLARLLDPTDYGVLTLLTIFITISQVFVQSGFNTALIQRKDVTEKDYSSVFYLSLSIALILYVILFFSAPFIADFYDMPQLKRNEVQRTDVLYIRFCNYIRRSRNSNGLFGLWSMGTCWSAAFQSGIYLHNNDARCKMASDAYF